ncbi:hypothetical protein SteCoe_29921 [Stentor coeruleus]|uniref:Uncharacterized protein n=1 Tax=Stentor coeruleus TaxID=5963 RepID=A0A1R2B4U5_9CILI|nr:hypothetical protein SteCoe_29921 [Stentor coeruleus]
MKKNTHIHDKTVGDTFPDKIQKLPFLTKRVHPLQFHLPFPTYDTFKHRENLKQFQTPKHKSNHLTQINSKSIQTYEIPHLKYSEFKASPHNLCRKARRKSDFSISMTELLESRYHMHIISEPRLNIDANKNIKESIVNKRAFKRIETHEIKCPANSLGEKLVRMHQLVIDPLIIEGEFLK